MKNWQSFPSGSSAQVLAHAAYQRSRGRQPSMTYKSERNPHKALALAKETYNKVSKNMKEGLSIMMYNLKRKEYSPYVLDAIVLRDFNLWLSEGVLTYRMMGFTEAEFGELVRQNRISYARWMIRRLFEGAYTADWQIKSIVEEVMAMVASGVADWTELGTRPSKLQALVRDAA